jgi:hypothetical protein
VDGRGLDDGDDLDPFLQGEVGPRGARDESREAGAPAGECHSHERPFGSHRRDPAGKVVSGAAPGVAAPLQDDVLGAEKGPDVAAEASVDGGEAQPVPFDRDETVAGPDDPARQDGVDADAAGDLPVGRTLEDVRHAAVLPDPAVHHDGHPVAERERLDPVVRDDDGRDSEPEEEGAQLSTELFAGRSVERREGFVEEEEAGRGGDGARDGDALLLAAGELGRAAGAEALELQEGDRPGGPPVPLGGRDPAESEGDVLVRRKVGKEGVILEEEADAAPAGRDEDSSRRVEPGLVPADDRPSSGRSSPARERKTVVLPEPDGPKRTVTGPSPPGRTRSAWIAGPPRNLLTKRASRSAAMRRRSGAGARR